MYSCRVICTVFTELTLCSCKIVGAAKSALTKYILECTLTGASLLVFRKGKPDNNGLFDRQLNMSRSSQTTKISTEVLIHVEFVFAYYLNYLMSQRNIRNCRAMKCSLHRYKELHHIFANEFSLWSKTPSELKQMWRSISQIARRGRIII